MSHDTCIARLEGVHKRYGAVNALDGINLTIHRGELLALLGPNGAGKTTSISLLLGLHRADQGTVSLFGKDPQDIDARRRIGVMLQSANLPPTLKVRELIRVTASYYPNPRSVAECATIAGITDLLDRRYAALSGGQQRRVQFAMALAGNPELLFLDEPTVGLDLSARQALWASIRSLVASGSSVVLTTHYLEEAEALADRVCVIARGRVISEGTVDALRAHVSVRRIRCITSVPAESIAAWPEVDTASLQQGHMVIATQQAEAVVRRLLAIDADLAELEVQRAGLAEAFTEITRDSEAADAAQEAA
ncbi:ABC transporter ATP-binding protein [Luteibacter aegosomatissinici]|uniref:ABC transporter ATP-binding protein n=1 Tax=Luteibacter aegosomatissinici TaxID=2911539 RepID=UPI001FF88605|nr:ABC transporter ATP-binding protein [Luteibacter aegosomatissinici]UPG95761.1 ABC transporter ATP-binding protein [Luteibacter aegosomatissinici]